MLAFWCNINKRTTISNFFVVLMTDIVISITLLCTQFLFTRFKQILRVRVLFAHKHYSYPFGTKQTLNLIKDLNCFKTLVKIMNYDVCYFEYILKYLFYPKYFLENNIVGAV